MNVKTDTPDKQDEEYIQMRVKCEAYEIKYGGKKMPSGQVLVARRVIHDYRQRLQTAIDMIPRGDGNKIGNKKISTTMKTAIDKDAVRGNKQNGQETNKQTRPTRRAIDCNSLDSEGPNSNRRDRDHETPNSLQLAGGKGDPP